MRYQNMIELAASAVEITTGLLAKLAETGFEAIGKKLFEGLKKKFKHPGAEAALDDLAADSGNEDLRGQLRIQLGKALKADPELAEELKSWMEEVKRAGLADLSNQGNTMTANVSGGGKLAQVIGKNNNVKIG
jgi:hypothetical protein